MSRRRTLWLLVAILLLSTASILFQAARKDGFHIDEIYTFGLSNYEDSLEFLRYEEDGKTPKWNDKEDLYRFLSVSEETRFDYKSVIRNQKNDVHPPLYYILFHTASSFTPNVYSKYTGVFINLLFTIGTLVLLFLIADTIFKKRLISLAVTVVFAFSPNCINMATYLRMYAMLTFFCMLLLYINIKLFEKNYIVSKKDFFLLILSVVAGSLTHYYFLIFAFSVFAVSSYQILKNRTGYKGYIFAYIAAGVLYILLWPTVFKHLFFSARGNEAFANAVALTFLKNIKENFDVLVTGTGKIVIAIFIISTVMGLASTKSKHIPQTAIIGLIYFLVISQIAPYRTDRYIAPLFPIICLVGVYYTDKAVKILWIKAIRRRKTASVIIISTVISLVLGMGIYNNFMTLEQSDKGLNYLYLKSEECKRFLAENEGKRCLVVYDDWQDILPSFNEYETFSETAFVAKEELGAFLENDAFKTENEMVIYINNQLDIDEIFKTVEEKTGFHSYGDILHEHYRHWAFACALRK